MAHHARLTPAEEELVSGSFSRKRSFPSDEDAYDQAEEKRRKQSGWATRTSPTPSIPTPLHTPPHSLHSFRITTHSASSIPSPINEPQPATHQYEGINRLLCSAHLDRRRKHDDLVSNPSQGTSDVVEYWKINATIRTAFLARHEA
ncbi:uncharacterized protein VTP21DRAFT_5663 [Calcarisporiella thermophila]|uniref:uncharacterized protein n=1 Tax=Calcarisporiella thermophila TaxID=911321 RepID=UPI0037429421